MNDIIFFINSYKYNHKSLYKVSFICFFIGIFLPLLLLSFINNNQLLFTSFAYIIVTLIDSYFLYKITKYKREFIDNYYDNVDLDKYFDNTIAIIILLQYFSINFSSFFLMLYFNFNVYILLFSFIISTIMLCIELFIIRKKVNTEYTLVIKANNVFYILKDYTINLYTNGETIYDNKGSFLKNNYKINNDENISELVKGYTKVLRKILSNKYECEKI